MSEHGDSPGLRDCVDRGRHGRGVVPHKILAIVGGKNARKRVVDRFGDSQVNQGPCNRRAAQGGTLAVEGIGKLECHPAVVLVNAIDHRLKSGDPVVSSFAALGSEDVVGWIDEITEDVY